jgi:hypothetical protein
MAVEADGTRKTHIGGWVLNVIGSSSLHQDVTNSIITARHSFRPIGFLLAPEETIEGFYQLSYGVAAAVSVLYPGCVMKVAVVTSDRSAAVRLQCVCVCVWVGVCIWGGGVG